jgi:L-rhamnose mutarotase
MERNRLGEEIMSNQTMEASGRGPAGWIRKGFVMAVLPGLAEEYERRHRPIWKELEKTLRDHGVHNYSIFHDAATNTLFGYVEIESDERWAAIGSTEIYGKWREYMCEVMVTDPPGSPVYAELKEVFHQD